MTAIGKIFVIINLLFSLVVAGFIMMVYIRSENWYLAQKKWEEAARASDASRQAAEKELVDERVVKDARIQEKDTRIKELEGRIAALEGPQGRAATIAKEMEEYKKSTTPKDAELASIRTELEKRAKEIDGLEKQIQTKDSEIAKQITAKNDEIAKRIASDINATSFKNKAEGLEKRVRETEMKLAKMEARGNGSGGSVVLSSGNNPAPRVDGVVLGEKDGLVQISVGGDSGLEKDQILDVYRLRPTELYLGQIRLKDVRAKDAVGVFLDKPKGKVVKGDLVSDNVNSRN